MNPLPPPSIFFHIAQLYPNPQSFFQEMRCFSTKSVLVTRTNFGEINWKTALQILHFFFVWKCAYLFLVMLGWLKVPEVGGLESYFKATFFNKLWLEGGSVGKFVWDLPSCSKPIQKYSSRERCRGRGYYFMHPKRNISCVSKLRECDHSAPHHAYFVIRERW